MVDIGISGICGKMGRRILALALKEEGMRVTGALDRPGVEEEGRDISVLTGGEDKGVIVSSDVRAVCGAIDCLIEFTFPGPTVEHARICAETGTAMVIGTTGMNEEDEKAVKECSGKVPIVFSPNMAVGVNVVFNVIRQMSSVLGKDFDIKVDETHHVHKKDSPSGTAKMMARIIKESSGKDVSVEAFREGETVGNHGISFSGEYESIELRHDAKSRDVFVAGALKAAKFIKDKGPGLYDMADVLGLKQDKGKERPAI